jgi:DNA sulfur modification protein DndD
VIINEIVLHNYGVYLGRQRIALRPSSAEQPVILVGGQNGVGKTTLLDALQLALYGRLAQCSNRLQLSYEDFLRRGVHHAVDPADGAAIELEFSHVSEGREHTYRVHRSWRLHGSGIRERVEVQRDGRSDAVLTDTWEEHIEAILPRRIAPLFFFDGEKIEALADPARSAELLSIAIHSLLGVDLVDQLQTDLAVLERRKRTALKTEEERHAIDQDRQELAVVEEEHRRWVQERAAAVNDLHMAQKALAAADERFRAEGGQLFETQAALEEERVKIQQQLEEVEKELRDLASEAAPLLLVAPLLSAVVQQDSREERAREAALLTDALEQRDQQLMSIAQQASATTELLTALTAFLAQDRELREKEAQVSRYLRLSEDTRSQLGALQGGMLAITAKRVQRLLDNADQLHHKQTDSDRKFARIPSKERIAELLTTRNDARTRVQQTELRLHQCTVEADKLERHIAQLNARLVAQIERRVEREFADDAANRIISHAVKIRQTLDHFRVSLVQRHVERIARFVLESFQQLLRKNTLVADLLIDPHSFAITMHNTGGEVITPERLSAGERQLLAVAMLWGLARASEKPLPIVIDTPLGRLDRAHRIHLIKRYFPNASHQVLLLSTDEEIRDEYLEMLRPSISVMYSLDFDDATGATSVNPGYFVEAVA